MTQKKSEWNGFTVYGDIRELDGIANTDGLIHLDKEDIFSVLSAEGKNYLTSSVNANLDEAFNEAINTLPCEIEKINSLLIDFRYGNKQLKMSELSSITSALSEVNPNIKVIWGMSSDERLGDSYKVTLLASVRA
ncbi:MAG: hypothetical protein K2M72_09420 [Paramuribaculum sp.]|nr:hypothetical protein [Paramuribaculum sp.]